VAFFDTVKSFFGGGQVEISSSAENSTEGEVFAKRRSRGGFLNQAFGTKGGGEKYQNGISGNGSNYQIDAKTMAINARRASHDSVEARAIIDRNCDVVVDTGIKVAPACKASILGITDEQADEWNRNTGERFHLFLSSKKCHRQRMMNGYEAQRLWNRTFLVDNDQYTRFFFTKERDALSTVSFQFIDPLNIAGDPKINSDGTLDPDGGIKRDSKGREVSYLIQRLNESGEYEEVEVPKEKNDRIFMSHGFLYDQISQLSGFSQYGHLLQEFQELGDFRLAHIDKAIAQANFALAVENDGDNDPSNPFEFDVTGDAVNLDGLKFTDLDGEQQAQVQEMTYDSIQNFNQNQRGSVGILNLRAKDKIHMLKNEAPVTNYDKFVESFVSYLSASARMPIEVLLMKFGSNYSASRGALILFYRIAEIYRKKIDVDFLTPLYYNWLAEEIAAGRVECLGWSDPVLREAWLCHDLEAAQVPNIDPLKTAYANKENIAIGATTYDRAAQETNGSSGSANRTANKRQAENLDVPYWEQIKNEESPVVEKMLTED
jgi:capsid protein